MMKIKNLGFIAIASTTVLFSGCVQTRDTFYGNNHNQAGYWQNNSPRISASLVAYAYPHYYDRPYYFLNNTYYYGGFFKNGFYHYGHKKFRRGHYYSRGHRYYRGNRYRAINGRYGYYNNRGHYERSRRYKRQKARSLERGRLYESRDRYREPKRGKLQTRNHNKVNRNDVYTRSKSARNTYRGANNTVQRRVRHRD